ncbi:nuclear pore complex protein Nup214 isoform X2 [Malaya genurostris]|nr:nuclear pore complex protein Nup214 isoform X2 [Malaya genurostris]
MATSCDHELLAIDVISNNVPFIHIYSVASFLMPTVKKLYEIRTSPEGVIRSTQLLWNPVIHNMLSLRTENGALSVYTLKEPTGIEFHSLDKSEGAMCACWSPKGKQLVVGFANGKLVQYKPDLKLARTITCPVGVIDGDFDVIALQWLSTYQFAAVFLSRADDSVPALFIVNAPKIGNPVFINYDDICYSQSVPRKGQVFLQHILPWNLLLMASANSMEVGILGTTEIGETPTWFQWTTTDESRAELPLSSDKQETFPVGLTLETGCTHVITIGEQTYPVMPMIHMLSTYGFLVSFNILNLTSNIPNICSPPKPITDCSGKFQLNDCKTIIPVVSAANSAQKSSDISFAVPMGATSTPAVMKTKSFFSPSENKSPINLFGGGSNIVSTNAVITPTFGKQIAFSASPATQSEEPVKTSPFGNATSSFTLPAQIFVQPQTQSSLLKNKVPQPKPLETAKPLVTVSPTYTPPPTGQIQRVGSNGNLSQQPQKPVQKKSEASDDTNSVIRSMIFEELRKFERELSSLKDRCKSLNTTVGSKGESANIVKNLKELQDLSVQATESTDSLTSDVQALRLSLNEAFAMVAEANSKNSIYKHPSPNQFQETHAMSQSSRRQLTNLQNMLAINKNQLQVVNKHIDAQWSIFQEANRANSKQRMHVPSLEVLYQTLSKQQEILNRQREKISILKSRLGMRESIRGLEKGNRTDPILATVDSLTDSIISMTIADQVREDARRMDDAKMNSLRNMLRNRKIITIKPGRPDRVGLNSEVIRERRNEVHRINMEKQKVKAETISAPNLASTDPKKTEKVKPKPKAAEPEVISTIVPGKSAPAVAVKEAVQEFEFGSKPNPVTPTAVTTGARTTPGPVFNFGQATPNFGQPAKTKEGLPKETVLFGNTTIKQIPAMSKNTLLDKENQEPSSRNTTLFGFGSTTIQAISKTESSSPATEKNKPVLTFGSSSNSNNKPATFSFGAPTGGPLSFGLSQNAPPAATLNFTKERESEPKKAEKSSGDVKPDKPFHVSSSENNDADKEGVKAAFPAITNLLKNVDPISTNISKASNLFGTDTKSTPATIFGVSTAASSTGIFGSINSTTTPSSISSTSRFTAETEVSTTDATTPETSVNTTTATSTTPTLFGSFKLPTTTSSATVLSFGNIAAETKVTDLSTKKEAVSNTVATSLGSSLATVPIDTAPSVSTVASTTTTPSFSFGSVTVPAVVSSNSTSTTTPTTSTTDMASNLFGSFNICSPTVTTSATPQTGNIFGSTSFSAPKTETTSIFGTASGISTPAVFGAASTDASKVASNLFGSVTAANSVVSTAPETGLFGSVAVASSTGTSIFGSSPATTGSPFSAGTLASTGSGGGLFGSVNTQATSTQGSIFGGTTISGQQSAFGSVTVPTATTASSIFGSAGATSGGLFGSVGAASTAGGSIFGGTASFTSPSASTGNIFGSSVTGSTGFGSSAFGQPSSPQPAQSIFGGAGTASTFGSSSFGSNSGGAFSQPVSGTVAQTGFGSPTSSAFNKPTFGGPAAFGGVPAFGGTPTFGGTPGFGSPPAFGSKPSFGVASGFGQAPLSPSTQSNNLFEQLGSSTSGVSFGNLAQQPTQKSPQFGGSSFSSWRS